ncbi:hypothetical protein, partial [Burkholderia sp. B10]|uniref:hypothetical protein n=1 Tax=Burkholderia sp. B10 TaxID=1178627 RepID=UPI001AB05538
MQARNGETPGDSAASTWAAQRHALADIHDDAVPFAESLQFPPSGVDRRRFHHLPHPATSSEHARRPSSVLDARIVFAAPPM